MCEEVRAPATQVPKAMVYTIVLNTFAGLLTLIPMMFVLPNIDDLLAIASGQPVPAIIKSAIGSSGGSFALLIPLLVLALTCGIGCTTAASRCIWAFARDGAIPGSHLWKTVDRKLGVPLNAMMLSMVIQIILGLIYFGSTAAFNAFSGVGVICLTTSYAMPIAVSLLNRREALKDASFNLGAMGPVCNYIALGMFLSCLPACLLATALTSSATHVPYRISVAMSMWPIAGPSAAAPMCADVCICVCVCCCADLVMTT